MGLLSDQYASPMAALLSQIESAKRKAKGLFTDPIAQVEMVGGRIKDDPEAFAQQLAGMAGVIKPIKFTPSEIRFFKSLDPINKEELKMMAPSAKFFDDGTFHVDPSDASKLDDWVMDVMRLNEGERLPPSFYSGEFSKRFYGLPNKDLVVPSAKILK